LINKQTPKIEEQEGTFSSKKSLLLEEQGARAGCSIETAGDKPKNS
jgi:hypothetical protein